MIRSATSRARATSYDVARMAGVAQSTVSRCFQGDSTISGPTRHKVLEAATRLGYVPNALARSLITRRSNMVGVVITRYTLRGNPDVIYAIGESLAAAEKQLLLITVESDWPAAAALRGALEYPLDGLISCVLLAESDLTDLLERFPVVFYNRCPDRSAVDSVTANHAAAAADVATALYGGGHRRFLCIAGPANAPVSQQRIHGFIARLSELGVQPVGVLETDYSYAGGRAALLEYAQREEQPDALFCANDQLALGAMDAARFELGWTVPDDLSIVGFDDVAEAARPIYRLTTVHQDSLEMARQAVKLLLTRLADPLGGPITSEVPSIFMSRTSARLREP